MKLTVFFTTAVGVVLAQNLSGQPPCATSCLVSAISAAGCAADDTGCQCGPTQTVIASKVAGCLLAACTSPSDLSQAKSAGEAVCSSYSATATASSTGTTAGSTSGTTAISTPMGNLTMTSTSSNGAVTPARITSRPAAPTSTFKATATTKPPSVNAGVIQTSFGTGMMVVLVLGAVVVL